MTNFTIYQLSPGDNIKAIAVIEQKEEVITITNLLLKGGLDVWYEPDDFEIAFKHMLFQEHLGRQLNGEAR